MELEVQRLLEESAKASLDEDYELALDRAREAGLKERKVCKHRDNNGLADSINLELTFAVCYNLADAFAKNEMYQDSIQTYNMIVSNDNYPQSGRMRVNMGRICRSSSVLFAKSGKGKLKESGSLHNPP